MRICDRIGIVNWELIMVNKSIEYIFFIQTIACFILYFKIYLFDNFFIPLFFLFQIKANLDSINNEATSIYPQSKRRLYIHFPS